MVSSFNKSSLEKKTKTNHPKYFSSCFYTKKQRHKQSHVCTLSSDCLSFPLRIHSALEFLFFLWRPHLLYGFLHLPFFSRCWNFLSLRAHVSLHWITRLPLSATTPLCPGESSSFPSSRYFFPGFILGHLQATSLARTHRNWSPRRMRLSPCL